MTAETNDGASAGGGFDSRAQYRLFEPLAAGGMATVYLGQRIAPLGYRRPVAVKRLHAHLAHDPEHVAMQLDEARLSARLTHANLVPVTDVIVQGGELLLVMEYVHGVPLSWLRYQAEHTGQPLPEPVLARIGLDVLSALHGLHSARDAHGRDLAIVHRDVSPQNVMVGVDGVARLLDLGIAKAAWRSQLTRDGECKGKPAYMAPEQIEGRKVDRRSDLFSVGILLCELVSNERLHPADEIEEVLSRLRRGVSVRGGVELARAIERALEWDPDARFPSAEAMAEAVAEVPLVASAQSVAAWVREHGARVLEEREGALRRMDDAHPTGRSLPASSRLPRHGSLAPEASTITSARALPSRQARRWPALLALVALLAALGSFGVVMARPRAAEPVTSAQAAAPAPPARALPAPIAANTARLASASEPAPLEPVAGARPTATERHEPPVVHKPSARPSPSAPSKPTSNPCSPPYESKDGIRVYKEECL